jgi:hypothetical protein
MKKTYLTLITILLFAGLGLAQITNTITFRVDMNQMVAAGFNPDADSIRIAGLTWDPYEIVLSDSDPARIFKPGPDNIYTTTVILNCGTANVGDSLRWKLYVWPGDPWNGNYEGGFGDYDGNAYYVQANGSEVILDPVVPHFQRLVTGLGPQNTFHIMADVTNLVGTGSGYFDPAIDSLVIEGFTWGDGGIYVSGVRGMTQNPLMPGVIYETSLVIELDSNHVVGDSLRWKFHAYPENRWSSSGWEPLEGRYTVFQEDGAVVEVGPFEPNISPLFNLQNDSQILFQIDMNHNPTNRYDSSYIPIDKIEFISLRGSHPVLGSWNGVWEPVDTLTPGVPALYDNGYFGDKVAGDNIWSRLVTFPAGSVGGQIAYKYGVYYPGCELIHSTYYMDGYGGEGKDILTTIKESSDILEILDVWPNHKGTVSVKQTDNTVPKEFVLQQNYPNPFNPVTTIEYRINKGSDINLSIYNVLGEKVMQLVNVYQDAGSYEVKFDASALSSGIYYYRISDGTEFITKKMTLLK